MENFLKKHKKLIEELKQDEGFRSEIYACSLGFKTIGYGTKLPLSPKEADLLTILPKVTFITEDNALLLLAGRLKEKIYRLNIALPWLESKNEVVKDVLYNMSYQMGVNEVLKFKKTLEAIKNDEYVKASIEMLDSLWAKQTPKRALRLAMKIQGLSDGKCIS